LGWGTVAANAAIAAAYWALPLAGLWLLRRRPSLAPDRLLALLCLAFVGLCGTTHALDAATFWWPAYRLNAVVRTLTALVSLATLGVLVWRRRVLLSLPTPAEYAAALADRDEALTSAALSHANLRRMFEMRDRQNAKLTAELDAMRDSVLRLQADAAHHEFRRASDAELAALRAHMHAIRGAMQ